MSTHDRQGAGAGVETLDRWPVGTVGVVSALRAPGEAPEWARLLDEIAKATNNPDLAAASDELQSQIAATRNSPALLTPEGWPSGGSQHGVNPSQTNKVPGGGGGGAPR